MTRQDYRTAVNKGTRGGSAKIVKEHLDTLCDIWGGSSATIKLAEGVDGDSLTVKKLTKGTVIYHSRQKTIVAN